jgi:hypothetical protein
MNDIDKMTPEELRIAIAKAKGWTRTNVSENGMAIVFVDPDGATHDESETNWPADIVAAWTLVEEMADQGDVFIESWQDDEWFIANHPLPIKPRGLARDDGKATGKRDICLAICRAWLAWDAGKNRYDMGE